MYSLEVNRITVNACMHFESLLQFQINSSCTRQDTLVRGKNLMEKPKKEDFYDKACFYIYFIQMV